MLTIKLTVKKAVVLGVLASLYWVPSSEAALFDPSLKWKTTETEHFSIHYYEGEEAIASRLREIAEEAYRLLSKEFDARPWGKTEVIIVDNHDMANGFTQVIPYNSILLRVVPPTADNTLGDYDDWLRQLFVHEYTHVIHLTDTRYPAKLLKMALGKLVAPNGLAPGWVVEGIATYYEGSGSSKGGRGRSSFTEMMLRTDILKDRFLHLDQMAGNGYSWPTWLPQYHYGVAFWNYLTEKYGKESLTEFSHKYGASLWFFSLNNKAKRVFKSEGQKKSFYRLWGEWKKSLEEKYQREKKEIERGGLQEGEALLSPSQGESFSLPTFSPDGEKIAYLATSIHHRQELRVRDIATGHEETLLKKKDVSQLSFSPDGGSLFFSYVDKFKKYYNYSDIYRIDLTDKKKKALTEGRRVRDADWSKSGDRVVAVRQRTGSAELILINPESKESNSEKVLWTAYQLDHPRWLPDGKSIVVSAHVDGRRDLWIVDAASGSRRRITSDGAVEDRPVVSPGENALYYSSDVSGVSNIYRKDLKTGKVAAVTNVLTGAFSPSVSPEGDVVFVYYTGEGYELRRLPVEGRSPKGFEDLSDAAKDKFSVAGGSRGRGPTTEGHWDRERGVPQKPEVDLPSTPYRPFRRLFLPRYLFPNVALIDGAVFASAGLSNYDPLNRHFWYGDVTFRSDNQFIGWDAGYTYSRFRVPVSVGYSDFTVNYGDVFGLGADFFEERRRGFAGVSIPISSQRVNLNYFFEDRSHESGLPAGTTLTTLGRYAGFFAQYAMGKTEGTSARISPEEGGKLTLNAEVTDHVVGASNSLEQEVFWADGRLFLSPPWGRHQVLALRATGGAAFGDQLLQGNFGLGGSIGESPFTGTSTRVFTLRGLPLVTFSSDYAWVASAEYRFPLFRLERGLGTLPFALNTAHIAFFADVGDAFNQGNPDKFRPLLGVGGELRGDFVVGYYLPVMGRLGYGVLVTNRNRIIGATDDLTGADARNGVLILELGTSF